MATPLAVLVLGVWLCADLTWAAAFGPNFAPPGFPRPPFAQPPPPPLHSPPEQEPPKPERPHKQFTGTVCPTGSKCVKTADCTRQCRPGWDSFDQTSCYFIGPARGVTRLEARTECAALEAHPPILERRSELDALVQFGPIWTDAKWDVQRTLWTWESSGQAVDFVNLGVEPPGPGSQAEGCLKLVEDQGRRLVRAPCSSPAFLACETGSSSVARCKAEKGLICCALDRQFFPDPPGCFVDDLGTRCEQRLFEGYFPLAGGLVKLTEGAVSTRLPWHRARELCQHDGGDLLIVDSKEVNDAITVMIKGLEILGGKQYYIGLTSNSAGEFKHVDGTPLTPASYQNFATVQDGSRPNACVYYQEGRWQTGEVCTVPRDYVCHIPPARLSFTPPQASPRCGQRQPTGPRGKLAGFPGGPPPPPPLLPPLGPHDDGRRGAAQFAEFPWQAAIWRQKQGADYEFVCSGALVDGSWVLTSTSCVSDLTPDRLKVTLGDWSLDGTEAVPLPPIAVDVEQIRTSPERTVLGPYGPVTRPGRLSLLYITPPILHSEYAHISPLCLPESILFRPLHELKCVVTGWLGGLTPFQQFLPFPGLPEPDRRDILRKLDTSAASGPDCQQLAHHLTLLKQTPPPPPPVNPFVPPFGPHPPVPYPFSSSGRSAGDNPSQSSDDQPADQAAGGRSGFQPPFDHRFQPAAFFEPPQEDRHICLRDLRCIPDPGALLACVVAPPPLLPPPPFPVFPRPAPIFRTTDNTTEPSATPPPDTATTPPPTPSPAPEADSREGIAEIYEKLSPGFRPPVLSGQTPASSRARRDAEQKEAASDDQETAAKSDRGVADSSGFDVPHLEILKLFGALPPSPPPALPAMFHGVPPGAFPPPPPPPPPPRREAYTLVGVASELTAGCDVGQMIFDDVIQEIDFMQEVVGHAG